MNEVKVKLRYAIGRTNKPNEWSGKSGTANFHVNPVFACVTSTQWSNRGGINSCNKMKFIYKIPHGYFSGGAYFKYSPTITSSAWDGNHFLVWITE